LAYWSISELGLSTVGRGVPKRFQSLALGPARSPRAAATKLALDERQAEHAPQKEGDPTGKSTVERGSGSLNDVLSPLLSLTDRLAELVPALRSPDLAIPFARLVVTTIAAAAMSLSSVSVIGELVRALAA
jgi:hypothetical protein